MKLFVAKLNRDAVESDLLEWFGAMGPVRSVKVVTDRETGQSKCFGFVEMESRDAGEKAIAEMNGQEYMGFRMVVKEAEERGSRPRPSGGSGGSRDGRPRHLLLKVRKGAEVDRFKEVDLPSVRTRSPTNPRSPSVKSPTNTATAQGKPK